MAKRRKKKRGEEKWRLGVVMSQMGPVSYMVDVGSVIHWKCHTDQIQA